MGYKPQVVKASGGPSGKGTVQLAKKDGKITKVRIAFEDTEDTFIIPFSDCSEEVRSYIQAGTFNVRLGKDGKSLTSLSPWNGMFKVKVKRFVSQKDKDPVPQLRTGKTGDQTWSYQYFVPLLEVVEGDCKGMQIPYFMRYFFTSQLEEVNGKKVEVAALAHPKSPYFPQLAEFCEVSGVWEQGPMPYEDNLLPRMQKRILRQAREFMVIVKNGFVDNIYEESNTKLESEPLSEDDSDDGAEQLDPKSEEFE